MNRRKYQEMADLKDRIRDGQPDGPEEITPWWVNVRAQWTEEERAAKREDEREFRALGGY